MLKKPTMGLILPMSSPGMSRGPVDSVPWRKVQNDSLQRCPGSSARIPLPSDMGAECSCCVIELRLLQACSFDPPPTATPF